MFQSLNIHYRINKKDAPSAMFCLTQFGKTNIDKRSRVNERCLAFNINRLKFYIKHICTSQ